MAKGDEPWERMMIKGLSRRHLLKMGGLAGIGLASGFSLMELSGKFTEAETSTSTDQPQDGGILHCGQAGDPPNFDLISSATYMALHPLAPIYNNLVIFDAMEPNKIIGDLAEKWEISPDGKMYTFHLIKGVKFHDGKPCTSADVKFTFDLMRNPPQGTVSPRKASLAVVDGLETPDNHTVRFILKRAAPSLLSILAQGWMVVLPKHIIQEKGDMKKEAVGTGPFKFKKYTRGVSLEMVRNPDYHVKGRPYLDGITYYIIPDPSTVLANLRTGQLHFHALLTGDEARMAEKEFGDKVVTQHCPLLGFDALNFNSKRKPWDDIRVRQAASLAISRQEALKVVSMNDGDISGIMLANGIWALAPEELEKIPGYGKDVAANKAMAKKLLSDAGHANGFATTLLTRKGSFYEPLSVYIKDQLAQIGIDTKLDVQETAAAYDILNKKSYDLAPWRHGHAIDDPDCVFGEYYTCDAIRNYSGICSPEVDELYNKQSQILNFEERKKVVNQLDKAALLTFGKVPIYWSWRFIALSRKIRNYKMHPSVYNNQRMQDVWMVKS